MVRLLTKFLEEDCDELKIRIRFSSTKLYRNILGVQLTREILFPPYVFFILFFYQS